MHITCTKLHLLISCTVPEVVFILMHRSHFAAAFHIPPDFDDTCVNIGLGALLTSDGRFPAAAKQWKQQNKNFSSVFNSVKKYAYRYCRANQE